MVRSRRALAPVRLPAPALTLALVAQFETGNSTKPLRIPFVPRTPLTSYAQSFLQFGHGAPVLVGGLDLPSAPRGGHNRRRQAAFRRHSRLCSFRWAMLR